MHVSGFPLDLNWFLQFIATAFLIAVGLLHLLKSTASKYFVVDANFESSDPASLDGGRSDLKMPVVMGKGDACVVCGNFAKKQCSGCKLARYCSQTCQSSHWKSGHRTKCKDFQLSGKVNSMQSATIQRANKGSTVALVPANGTNATLKQSKTILFPYEDFVELFNWGQSGFPPCGLLNCGNSCFANVVLQCLAHTRPLVAYLLEKGHRRECRRNDWCFLCEFQTHIERATKSRNPFSPINILSRLPNIGGNLGYGEQEDAHEFMRFAIDTMQSVCLDEFGGEKALHPSSQETTLIQHIFGGHLQSQVICTTCNNISNQYENMMDLTVEIQGDAASLEECLDQFTAREKLHGDNMYKCDGCNDYVMAWKRLTIRRAPNILTIALKRFQSGRFGKLNKRVTFPETLDLRPYMSEAGDGNDIYKLYAVVVHLDMLNASFFGHYICYTKDFCGNWYRIDDCKVTSVELDEVLSQGAYMLLYSRVCPRSSCLVPIVPSRKEEEQIAAQKEEPFPEQPIQCLGTAESIHSIKVAASLPSDSSPQSKVSCCKEELSSMTNSDYTTDDLDIVDCGSSSSVTGGIELYGGDSSAMEETLSVDHAHRLVGGVVSHESSSQNSCLDVERRAENGSSPKELVLMNSSTKSALSSENGISLDVAIPDKMDWVGSKDKLESAVSGEDSVLSGDTEATTRKLAGKHCSETKLKPLFPPGFLGKPPHKYVTESGKASLELGKLASACNFNSGSNGFAKPGFPYQNGGNRDHVGKPLPSCNRSHATSSSTSFDEQDGNFLNEGILLGESINLGNGNSSTP